MTNTLFPPIARACRLFKTQAALAVEIGESPAFVNQMLHRKRPVPSGVARRIEEATDALGEKITRIELCPDTWMDIWPELATQPEKAGV